MGAPLAPHPTDQILYDYGLGKLQDPDASEVDVHLEACPACQQRVSELSGDSFVGRLRDAGTPPAAATPTLNPSRPPSMESPKASTPDPALAGKLPAELATNDQYTVLRELGRGGMGVVYLAHNTMLDRLEVLKVLNPEMLERKGMRERFIREMQSAANLDHPNIVRAYAAPPFGGLLVFAMEYVEGSDLSQEVKSQGPRPVAHACSFAAQAALGLQHAYERGMVHRDIKPGNLILMRQGKRGIVKILDFGLAKASSENPIDGGLTREGQMLGTPHYISPEQTLDAQTADIRADIYSLGCTLYYLLTGGPPFDGKSLYDILQGHQSMEARPLNLARPEVPVELAAVVGKMIAKERERRYQTPAEVAEALKPFFKPKVVGSGSSDGERSQPGRQAEERTPAGGVSPASEPAGAVPIAASGAAVAPNDPALMWKSLVVVPEPEHLSDARPPTAEALRGRPPWVGPALAVGIVLLLGLVVGWAAGLFIKIGDGVIVLEGVPEQAEVFIDGGKVSVQMHDGGGPVEVTVPAGRRGVQVKRDGFQTFGEEVSVSTGARAEIRVWLIPLPVPPPPVKVPREITNSIKMKLVLIPAGEFLMGSPDLDRATVKNEKPQHRVRITRPFYLGATEVTQGQYRAVMFRSPSKFTGSDDLPVERVSWNDAIAFCDKLSEREKEQLGGARYRLPTEAEWEYACRAGSTTRYSFGDVAASLGEFAWYKGNSDGRTHPVGQKRPNAWGLYDMYGNVWEQCQDGYEKDYYGRSPDADPLGPPQAAAPRLNRGGCWFDGPGGTRSANRGWYTPGDRLGFRVARVQSEASPVPPPVPKVIVKPPAPPIEEKKPAPTALGPDPQPTPTSKDAPKTVTNSIDMKLVLIPAGEFLMGSASSDKEAEDDEKPQHRVRITRPFYLGATEVTQGQYRSVTGQTPSYFKGSDDLPVEQVSWDDAIAFCDKLTEREKVRLGGERYRLPTETEWEYACRAGGTTRYSFGDNAVRLGEFGWLDGNSGGKTHQVGEKQPNARNLYDMHGNVWEWCQDSYDKDYYSRSPGADPPGIVQSPFRVVRGGCWSVLPRAARSAYRSRFTPEYRNSFVGFRVARVQSEAISVPPPVAEVTVNPPASPIEEKKAAPPARVPDPQPTPAPEEAPKAIPKKSTGPGTRQKNNPALKDAPKTVTNSIGMKLVLISPGEFLMGSPGPAFEKPQHQVQITRPFYLGATEVTEWQYRAVMGQGPIVPRKSDDLPKRDVSWTEAIAFCDKLSELEKWQSKGARYRLPTEAEWEYACRAGSTTKFSFGDDAAQMGEFAWYGANSGGKPHAVGQKRPNAWGLYDMHGNAWEMCWDGFDKTYYAESPAADPPGRLEAPVRVARGGCFGDGPFRCTSAHREGNKTENRGYWLGFRVARDQPRR